MSDRSTRRRPPPVLLAVLSALACSRAEPRAATHPPPGIDQRGVVAPRRLVFHPTDPDRLLVTDLRGGVAVWQLAGAPAPFKAWAAAAHATDAQFLPDGGSIATGGADGLVRVWDGAGVERWRSSEPHGGAIRAIAVGSDRIASAGEDGVIRLWEFDGTPAGALAPDAGTVLSVAFSPRADWLAAEHIDTRVHLWHRDDADHYAPVGVLREPNAKYQRMLPNLVKRDVQWGWDRSVAFAPSGTLLAATGLDGTTQIWNLDGTPHGAPLRGAARHHVRSVAFAPDGTLLAVGVLDGSVLLWNVDGSRHGQPLTGHQNAVSSVAFNRTGTRLASASIDGSVLLWNPADGQRLAPLPRGD